MTDEQNATPVTPTTNTQTPADDSVGTAPPATATPVNGANGQPNDVQAAPTQPPTMPEDDAYGDRLERLGGEPAPVITPEEFARLQRMGQVNIDAQGRVRTTRRSDAEAGVSLRKRRAWYKN